MKIDDLIEQLQAAKDSGVTDVQNCLGGLQLLRIVDGPGSNYVIKIFKIIINRKTL